MGSPREDREDYLSRLDMLKKKSLGQHFLTSSNYLRAIADAGALSAGETVLEIGPGDGALTRELLSRGVKVIAVEKDHRLISVLEESFATEVREKRLKIIEGDALEINTRTLPKNYTLVGNIPYYITGALIRKFLTEKKQPKRIVFLVQKEVAARIARDPKESLLSLSVKVYGEPKYVKTVPRGAFSPVPNVDSAILLIDNISRKHFTNTKQEERFFELLHAGFAHKRKKLISNLEAAVKKESLKKVFTKVGLSENVRAEDVMLQKWLILTHY